MWLEIVLFLLVIAVIWQSLKKPPDYPPGPWGLPFIGSLPLSLDDYYKKLKALKKKHGKITSWRIGSKLIVSLFDFDLVKEALQHPDISDRPSFQVLMYMEGGQRLGLICSTGIPWQNNRRFALRHLRDFGMSKSKLLPIAHYEADFLISDLKKQVGRPTSIPNSLTIAILNVLWQMVGSRRYALNDEEIDRYCHLVEETHEFGSKLIFLDVFPWAKGIIPHFVLNYFFKMDAQTKLSDEINTYFRKYVNEHIQDLDEHDPRDYIDAYLIEMNKNKSNPDSTMSVDDLIFSLSDLFEVGTETTTLMMQWALLYLAKFPRVQELLQKEIDEVLSNKLLVTLEDQPRLPYTDAFIHEALRYASISTTAPREASKETRIGGYTIPKGAVVIAQVYAMHYDPKYFDSPKEFRPERFLDSEGNFSTPKDGFVPFGYGKRVCLGEIVARAELLVFITKLIQNFDFAFPPDQEYNLESAVHPVFRIPKDSPKLLITLR